jgi:hypothetical protein
MEKTLRPYYKQLLAQDRELIKEAARVNDPNYRPGFRARLMKSFAEDGLAPTLRRDVDVRRAMMRGFNMLGSPTGWVVQPQVLVSILATWAAPRSSKSYSPPPAIGYDAVIELAKAPA